MTAARRKLIVGLATGLLTAVALFVAVVPAMGALLAAPVLGERLTASTLVRAALVSLRMLLAVGRVAVGPGRAAATAGQSGGIVPGSRP